MIYPGIGELVAKIQERKKVVILCTNGMFIRKKLDEFKPSRTFFFNVHLDGMRKNHDIAVEREGVFDAAIDGIKAAKEAGFLVCTNTTVYKETDMAELDELFAYLTTLDVDGFIISPAYSYAAVNTKEIFMTREDIKAKFRAAEAMFRSTASTPRRSTRSSSRASARCSAPPGPARPATSRAGRAPAT